jgi:hypothetical protein
MGGLGSWLLALSSPIAKAVMRALGFGVVSYLGVDMALGALLADAKAAWSSQNANVAVYLAMAGGNTALSIIAGAMVARVALIPLKTLRLL